jgi:hypothetical protein
MNPTFCTYRECPHLADAYFAEVAGENGLGNRRPGLALSAQDERLEVIVAADGRVAPIDRAFVDLFPPEAIVLSLMDAVEEAIEDALEGVAPATHVVERLEANLALMERTYAGA